MENMRLDAALLADAENGCSGWRVYGWLEPTVSLGRFQSPDRDLAPDCPVPWVMRPTGGGAVLHGNDLTVSIAACRLDNELRPLTVKGLYRRLATPIVDALRDCGVDATLGYLSVHVKQGRVSDCFAQVSPNDIVGCVSGVKVCGCALRVTRNAALLQASIPAVSPTIDPGTAIMGAQAIDIQDWNWPDFPAKFTERISQTAASA